MYMGATQRVTSSYLHVFCFLSSFGHSLVVPPCCSFPHSLPSLSLYEQHQGAKASIQRHIRNINVYLTTSDKCTDNPDIITIWKTSSGNNASSAPPCSRAVSCDVYVTCTASWHTIVCRRCSFFEKNISNVFKHDDSLWQLWDFKYKNTVSDGRNDCFCFLLLYYISFQEKLCWISPIITRNPVC